MKEALCTIMLLSSPEDRLCQLAEEAAELGQAALKLRRALVVRDTPVTAAQAAAALNEEFADIMTCIGTLACFVDTEQTEKLTAYKARRWADRLKERS